MRMKPSTIATACIISAIRGLKIRIDCRILRHICALTNSPIELVTDAVDRLEWIVAKEEESVAAANTVKVVPANYVPPTFAPIAAVAMVDKTIPNGSAAADLEDQSQLTPTDVQDVEF